MARLSKLISSFHCHCFSLCINVHAAFADNYLVAIRQPIPGKHSRYGYASKQLTKKCSLVR